MVLKNMKEKKFVREKNEDKWEKGESLISKQILTCLLFYTFCFSLSFKYLSIISLFLQKNSICFIYFFIRSSSSYYQEQRANMETLNILIICASVFWIIVFFLCLGPFLLSISKVAMQWKEYMGKLQNQTQSAEYLQHLKHQRKYSAPPQIIIRPPSWVRNMEYWPSHMSIKKMFYVINFMNRTNKQIWYNEHL